MTNILGRLTMSKLQAIQMPRGGVAWSGVILRDGKPYFTVENRGDGGCNFYVPVSRDNYREVRDEIEGIERTATAETGMQFEALDAITSLMEDGDTAAQHIASVKAEAEGG